MGLPNRVDLGGLEEAEQLRLHVEGGLADFVQEQGAAGGGADDALEVVGGAGERAAAMAEELGVEHVLRRGGAIEREERGLGAR